jgi:signal transduction histidine kinase
MSENAARSERARVSPAVLLLTALGVFISVIVCFELAQLHDGVVPIWFANALVLAILLNHSSRAWPHLMAAAYVAYFAANLMIANPVGTSIALALANCVEVVVIGVPLRFLGFDRRLTRHNAVVMLCVLACGPGVGLAALIAAGYLSLFGGANFYDTYFTWYFADVLALIIATPVFAAFQFHEFIDAVKGKDVVLNIAALASVLFTLEFIFYFARVPLLFMVFPVILMVTFRLGFTGGAFALVMVTVFSILATVNDQGPFMLIEVPLGVRLLYVQAYLVILNFTILQTAAALAGKRKAEMNLLRLNAQIRRAKERADTARREAEEADRGKSAFLASMSHELRTPLNAIIGFSEVMKHETFGPLGGEIYAGYANDIHKSGKHLLSLVNDVLELSRISSGNVELERETFDLKDVLHKGIVVIAPQAASQGVIVKCDFGNDPMMVIADRRGILQIFLNLLSNAVKFTPSGRHVRVDCLAEKGMAKFVVADEGIGIAEEDIPKVLSHYGQANGWIARRNQGHGLGLPIAKQLTELHGGTLEISSARDRGTKITIALPAEAQGTASPASEPVGVRRHLTAVA